MFFIIDKQLNPLIPYVVLLLFQLDNQFDYLHISQIVTNNILYLMKNDDRPTLNPIVLSVCS